MSAPSYPIRADLAWALSLDAAGDSAGALETCLDALAHMPDHADTLYLAAAMASRTGDRIRAESLLDRLIAAHPADARGWGSRGSLHLDNRRIAAALADLSRAVSLTPDDGRLALRHADALSRAGQRPAALTETRRACILLDEDPNSTPDLRRSAHTRLLSLSHETGGPDAWLNAARRLAAQFPDDAPAQVPLAAALWVTGNGREAAAVLNRITALDPALPDALWLSALMPAQGWAESPEDRQRIREDSARAAATLGQTANTAPERFKGCDLASLGWPFYLPYHGPVAPETMAGFGEALAADRAAWAAARPPIHTTNTPCNIAGAAEGHRPLVILVSAFWRHHTVGKLFSGWISGLDRARFRVAALHLGGERDAMTDRIAASADLFLHCPRDPEHAYDRLRELAPAAVIYPELGMNFDTLRLAALRLAPVQAVSWGHPVTTGLPTMDLFLSSALMEPPGAAAHYCEQLVTLPGLSITWQPPFSLPEDPAAVRHHVRDGLGLPQDAPVFLCLQTHTKYDPADDILLARIAAGCPQARFLFIEAAPPVPAGRLRARLGRAFAAEGADAERQIHMVPRLNQLAYRDVNIAGDIFLDTPGWSGGNTTLETIACGRPVVTLPGPWMRARHSAAILRGLDMADTIAESPEAYIETACRLAEHPATRETLGARIALARDALFTDPQPAAALSDVLEQAIHAAAGKDIP